MSLLIEYNDINEKIQKESSKSDLYIYFNLIKNDVHHEIKKDKYGNINPYDYQKRMIDEFKSNRKTTLVTMPRGTGKSSMMNTLLSSILDRKIFVFLLFLINNYYSEMFNFIWSNKRVSLSLFINEVNVTKEIVLFLKEKS